jgi:hypothetical protein
MPYNSERDIEIPKLFEFLDRHSDEIEEVLDVGCAGSQYLEELKKKGKIVYGVDFIYGEKEDEILEDYTIGDFLDIRFKPYDLVICLSTLEHYGVKQNPDFDYTKLQLLFFKKLVSTAKKFLFVTFPYGVPGGHGGEFQNIPHSLLSMFLRVLGNAKYKLSFYYNDFPQTGSGWLEISQKEADIIPYYSTIGVQCVCILEVEK